MSGKYRSPQVSFRDVSAALPELPPSLHWRIAMYPRPRNPSSLSPAIELVYVQPDCSTICVQRWGGGGRAGSTSEVTARLLVAAQSAFMFITTPDAATVASKILFELGAPIR